jgi:hypothetical protein
LSALSLSFPLAQPHKPLPPPAVTARCIAGDAGGEFAESAADGSAVLAAPRVLLACVILACVILAPIRTADFGRVNFGEPASDTRDTRFLTALPAASTELRIT